MPDANGVEPQPAEYPRARALASELADPLRDGGYLLLLDLEPSLGVHVAARLNALRLANPVLLLPRWPYPQAVLPVDRLLHSLLCETRRLTPEQALPNVAFVLDADRDRPIRRRSAMDCRVDNRYQLSPVDLPSLAALRARGIRYVVKVFGA